ncbi:hypothetical protein [Rossellomorea arthrocnemi]|jgi:hypothetical protein|nr:hypothetical protein [Rossellomorea arthrocnemi]
MQKHRVERKGTVHISTLQFIQKKITFEFPLSYKELQETVDE